MMQMLDRFIHKTLRRPYQLAVRVDEGKGQPIVLLHGLGRSFHVWQYLIGLLQGGDYRVVALDLLGFGDSPKPKWPRYDIEDHTRSIIATLDKCKLGSPAIIVGHSMGCLIAVHIATVRPDLVKRLVLYEMPLYAGLPDKRHYQMRLNFYFGLYKRIIAFKPSFDHSKRTRAQRLAEKVLGYRLEPNTWTPFIKSLEHTIMDQKTHQQIKQLTVPMDVIYGTKDRVVIRGKTEALFGEDVKNITAHTVKESHGITLKGSKFLLERIEAATEPAGEIEEAKAAEVTEKGNV